MRAFSLIAVVTSLMFVLFFAPSPAVADKYDACNATNTACRQACWNADKAVEGFNTEGCLSRCATTQSKCVGGFTLPKGTYLQHQDSAGPSSGGGTQTRH